MKKIILVITMIFSMVAGCVFWKQAPEKVGLIPLDSRPCNTQYPEVLGRMTNIKVDIPYDNLDSFLIPAQRENLWTWLEANTKNFDRIIINTNQLINGGLIASRDPGSYVDINEKIALFEDFCWNNKNTEIIVISVLPRLLPSQFTKLWTYQESLVQYAQEIDRNDLEGKESPLLPEKLPKEIWEEYFSVYEGTKQLAKKLIALADEGLIDHYLIGLDDAEQYGLSNKIIRELIPEFNEKVEFVHGADELTMLALSRGLSFKEKLNINLEYTNTELQEAYFPFEAAPLQEVATTKLNYLNLLEENMSEREIIIHNDPTYVKALENLVRKSDSSYLGIMDVAFTNKGDIGILNFLFEPEIWSKIKGYAGWNTAGNTIGTEIVHALSYQYMKENFKSYRKEAQEDALRAYLEFKYIRIAEDLIYQGILREELNKRLADLQINPHDIGVKHEEANIILGELFKPHQDKLNEVFLGEYAVGETKFTVEKASAHMELPWSRTFEAKVTPIVTIGIH